MGGRFIRFLTVLEMEERKCLGLYYNYDEKFFGLPLSHM